MDANKSNVDLSSRAMLAKLKISIWGGHASDKEAGARIIAENNASDDAGRFSKLLVPKTFLKPIRAVETAARNLHGELTAPWQNDGARILPSGLFMTYRREMKKFEDEFDREFKDVLAGYEQAKDDRQAQLGDLFNEEDYPSLAELAGKFGFELQISNLPDHRDFRVDLGEEAIAEIKRGMEKQVQDTYQTASIDVQRRLVKVMTDMADKLRTFDPKANRLHDTVIGNVRDLIQIMPELNIGDDPRINELIEKADEVIHGLTKDDLRDDTQVRNDTVAAADNLISNVGAMFGQ